MSMSVTHYDAIILGAGAAGLFCAGEAGRRGKRVLVLDHAKKIGEKIRISGGGRCNFTNINTRPETFISHNPKFSISALKRFTPQDFIDRVKAHQIAFHEKTLGQLFCNDSAQQIIDMLMNDCAQTGVSIRHGVGINAVKREGDRWQVETQEGAFSAGAIVVATGGKSIPKIGATGFGYDLACNFNIPVTDIRPGLVPLIFDGPIKKMSADLSGVSLEAVVSHGKAQFREGMLFTHRGLSGPSILQITNYWAEGEEILINLMPDQSVENLLREAQDKTGKLTMPQLLAGYLPSRVAQALSAHHGWEGKLAEWSGKNLQAAAQKLQGWPLKPTGSEGYRTAEVTVGGVDTKALNSKTMEVKTMPGLYFIGEVVDVTGWLGGYNFQWAWSSGFAAGQSL